MSKNKRYKAQGTRYKWKAKGWSIVSLLSLAACCLPLAIYAQEQFSYDAKGKRNPFIPLVTLDGRLLKLDVEEEKNKELNLEGIIYDPQGISYAIVNGAVVKTGDPINDFVVLKIEKNLVAFIKDNQVRVLELKKEGE